MVEYRVYCIIFRRPPSSLASLPRCGTTAVSNCIMMHALMYGMTPSEKTAQCARAPPLKRLKSEATPPADWASATLRKHSRKISAFTPAR